MTARTSSPLLFLLGILAAAATEARAQERPVDAATRSERAEIQKLIEQLGDDRFKIREEATRKLIALGEKALDAVEEARRSDDAEVRRRAETIVQTIPEAIRRLRADRQVRAVLARIQALPLDQLIDRMAARKEFDKPKNWERFHDMADAMTKLASKHALGEAWKVPKLQYKTFPTAAGPLELDRLYQRNNVRLDGMKDGGQSFEDCLIVSGGSIPPLNALTRSIVFINGDLAGCTRVSDCFLFCNGKLGRVASIKNSVILTTGNIEKLTSVDNVFFQAKNITGGPKFVSRQSVYLNAVLNLVGPSKMYGGSHIGSAHGPLQFVKPFEPAPMGVEFSAAGGRVRIDKVHDGKAFAKAGLCVGDIVLAADKDAIAASEKSDGSGRIPAEPALPVGVRIGASDAPSNPRFVNTPFHKYLRRRLAGDEFVLKVRRGEKIIECRVKLPD